MVQKLKPKKESPFKKGIFRVVLCGICKWVVASPSYPKLIGAGWRLAKDRDATGNEIVAFICKTCVENHPEALADFEEEGAEEKFFRTFPPAPENPFPCIGVEGHDTSRPREEKADVMQ